MNPTAWIVRIVAGVLVIGAIVNLALETASLVRSEDSGARAVAQAIENTLPLLGLAALLLAVSALAEAQSTVHVDDYAAERVAAGVEQLRSSVIAMQMQVSRILEQQENSGAYSSAESPDAILVRLNELKDLLLLDPSARQARIDKTRGDRKTELLASARRLIRQRTWHDADNQLRTLETDFAGDPDVINARLEYTAAATQFETEAVSRLRTQVNEMVSAGSWEQAHESAAQFLSQFPQSLAGQQILSRIQQERSIADETTAQEIFEEIRQSVDSRQWRGALIASDGFLERFPAHRRAEAIRQQLSTIRSNAEIEQRQEAEAHIQELIRAKRFSEAISMAEEIMERYPSSPQATHLQQMLPKMREMAEGERRSARKTAT